MAMAVRAFAAVAVVRVFGTEGGLNQERVRPIVVAYLMLTVLLFVTINLIVDILYSVLDPRVRISGAK
jgi:ABC-type microcin C transport system permease subunit YejB